MASPRSRPRACSSAATTNSLLDRRPTIYLIGINGLKRSGKNTVYETLDSLSEAAGENVLGIGFADKLKVLAARSLGYVTESEAECIALMDDAKERWVFDIKRESVYGTRGMAFKPVVNITGREFLQHLGSQARKVFGDTFWIDQVLPKPKFGVDAPWSEVQGALLTNRFPGADYVCLTDLRYPNEAERIKALGGIVWEVLRPGTERDDHDSEQKLPDELIDWQIHNNGSLADLDDRVREAVRETLR